MSDVESSLVIVTSDLVLTTSDVAKIETDAAAILVDTGTTLEARLSDVESSLVIISSDTLAIEVDTNSLNDVALTEISQGVPSATPTLQDAIMLMYMALRNKLDVATSGTDTLEVHNDAGTVICKKALTDDGTTYSEAEMATGP